MGSFKVDEKQLQEALDELKKDAANAGYFLNPDLEAVQELVEGLLINEERYGHRACPCRLASGELLEDQDIVCPCNYRDADIDEHGACYCALYVSEDIAQGRVAVGSIPDRRPPRREREKMREDVILSEAGTGPVGPLPYPVWRCQVCGYLCAREQAPGICPICKAKRERFERFI